MSIKIEGGNGTTENVIKSGVSNELLYNDKEVLLKENFDLSLLMPPDLSKTQEYLIWRKNLESSVSKPFTVPKDGWIVKIKISGTSDKIEHFDYSILINGHGGVGMTPSQRYIYLPDTIVTNPIVIHNLNCPYPVKEGQVVHLNGYFSYNISGKAEFTVTFAPCVSI